MDSSLHSVDNIPFQTPDQLNRVQRSEKDKEKKFSKALKEKMEEKLNEGSKENRQDEFLHYDENRQTSEQETSGIERSGDESESTKRPEDDSTDDDPSTEGHIDLKA